MSKPLTLAARCSIGVAPAEPTRARSPAARKLKDFILSTFLLRSVLRNAKAHISSVLNRPFYRSFYFCCADPYVEADCYFGNAGQQRLSRYQSQLDAQRSDRRKLASASPASAPKVAVGSAAIDSPFAREGQQFDPFCASTNECRA